jgi:hypothetical protein
MLRKKQIKLDYHQMNLMNKFIMNKNQCFQTTYQSRLPMSSFGIRTTAAGGGMMDDADQGY